MARIEFKLRNLDEARAAEEKLLADISSCGYDEAAVFAIRLAVEEALNNAIRHGNCMDSSKVAEFAFEINEKQVWVRIVDEGSGFDPNDLPDPTGAEHIEKASGRGVMLMKAYMDDVSFNERGNELTMVKYRDSSPPVKK